MTGRECQTRGLAAEVLFGRLDTHVRSLTEGSPVVGGVRRTVYEACVRGAESPPGCYSLAAPTGSGKTLAAMAFALRHAWVHRFRRVIVVLPFLSVIEQNAESTARCWARRGSQIRYSSITRPCRGWTTTRRGPVPGTTPCQPGHGELGRTGHRNHGGAVP